VLPNQPSEAVPLTPGSPLAALLPPRSTLN
jgi:hypothetical protein